MSTARTDPFGEPGADQSLSLTEAADALGVHYMTAYRYVRTGLLPAQRTGGRWWIEPGALDELTSSRAAGPAGPVVRGAPRGSTRGRASALADRLLVGDEAGAWRILEDALGSGRSLADLYLRLLAPAMEDVGERWAAGAASVGDEHRATVVAGRLVGRLGARSARPGPSRGTVVVSAAPGDRHALPGALLSDLLRERRLEVVDLGADLPPDEIAAAAAGTDRLLAVGICATTSVDGPGRRALREAVHLVHHRTGAPVLLGGRAAAEPGLFEESQADHLAADAAGAIDWLSSLTLRSGPATGVTS